jgi:hypothetical protein
MSGIFLSYRRSDSAGYTGRLADHLEQSFEVFRDIEDIEAGEDFVDVLDRAVGSCSAMLVIIGPTWATTKGADGRPRLEQPTDFVRLEVETALNRGVRLIPVLVGDAAMPEADQLPESLKPLARRQAHPISDRRWTHDIGELSKVLEKVPGLTARRATGAPPPPVPPAAMPHAPAAAAPMPPPGFAASPAAMASATPVAAASTRSRSCLLLGIGGVVAVGALVALGLLLNPADPAPTADAAPAQDVGPGDPGFEPAAAAPAAAPPEPVADVLAGTWRSPDGLVVHLDHNGADVALNGGFEGAGGFDGQVLVGSAVDTATGVALELQLALSPDGNVLVGQVRTTSDGQVYDLTLQRE